jgi:prevent-host-death family protein
MTVVTVREFSYNPSAMFARVEHGERIEVSRHGKVIAVVLPEHPHSQYDELVAQGVIKPPPGGGVRAGEWDEFVHIDVPNNLDPLAVLEEGREDRDIIGMLDALEAGR